MTELIAFGLPQGAEWLIILVVVLLFFGGAKIPQLMRGVGKGVGEFQAGLTQGKRALNKAMEEVAADDEANKGK
ncbi:MAG: twin-arginine translocase TatA/TatE family subunit [Fimbriimonadaceae bacterium]